MNWINSTYIHYNNNNLINIDITLKSCPPGVCLSTSLLRIADQLHASVVKPADLLYNQHVVHPELHSFIITSNFTVDKRLLIIATCIFRAKYETAWFFTSTWISQAQVMVSDFFLACTIQTSSTSQLHKPAVVWLSRSSAFSSAISQRGTQVDSDLNKTNLQRVDIVNETNLLRANITSCYSNLPSIIHITIKWCQITTLCANFIDIFRILGSK